MPRPLALLALCLLGGCARDTSPAEGGAPEPRREFVEVADEGQNRVRARVSLGLGTVAIAEAEPGALFQAEARLPAGLPAPTLTQETVEGPGGAEAQIGLTMEGEAASLGELRRGDGAAWTLYLGRRAPLELALELGATDATLDFSGVPLARLTLACGLARTRLLFTAANPVPMDTLHVRAGLAEFRGEGLGWAGFEHLRFEGGAGRFRLDFSGGALRDGARARIAVGLATLDVAVPAGRPVVIVAPRSSVTSLRLPEGFRGDGEGRFASPGVSPADSAAFRLVVQAGPGRIRVRLAE